MVYNAHGFLERTMQSVFRQDYPNLEYIVVDGASTDGTAEMIRDNEEQISRWVSEPDQGIYDAMNKGLRMATGEFVWFINAGDEIYDSDTVSKMMSVEGGDIYYGDTEKVDLKGNSLGLYSETTHTKAKPGMTWKDWSRGSQVCHQSFIAKRSLAPEFDLNYPFTADIDWEIKCLKSSARNVHTGQLLSKYLVDEGAYSKSNLRKSWKDRYQVLKKHFGFLPNLLNHFRILIRTVLG